MRCACTNYWLILGILCVLVVAFYIRSKKGACIFSPRMTPRTTTFKIFGFAYPFSLPPLPFAPNAREPYLDAETMSIHHDKHHQAYVDNLNKALEKFPKFQKYTIEELLTNLDGLPAPIKDAVRNNAGGHFNHSLYWNLIAPNGATAPAPLVAQAITSSFGSFQLFQEAFEKSALSHVGSGWTWLCLSPDKKLVIMSTLNHATPMAQGLFPVVVLDIWEHAYYLKYRNKRVDFVKNWWNVVNWDYVEKLYKDGINAMSGH
jgi:Fe-Mn family superoxide dismutase